MGDVFNFNHLLNNKIAVFKFEIENPNSEITLPFPSHAA